MNIKSRPDIGFESLSLILISDELLTGKSMHNKTISIAIIIFQTNRRIIIKKKEGQQKYGDIETCRTAD